MMSSSRRSLRGRTFAVLALAITALAALVWSAPASAHATLVAVVPADGSVTAKAPAAFSVSFSEPVSPLVLRLIRPDGSGAVLDRFVLRGTTLDIVAPPELGAGTYVLSWRVISEDGHPVGGSSLFSIGAPSAGGGALAAPETVDLVLDAAIWAARLFVYAGLFIGAGGAFFIRFAGGKAAAVPVGVALLAGLVALPLSVGLLGLDGLGLPLDDLLQKIAWKTGLATSYGTTAWVAAASLAAGLASLRADGRAARLLAAGALLGVGVALSASGHASAAEPQWLTRPAVFLHGVGIAFWSGALLPLASSLATGGAQREAVLRRFARIIPFALVPLVVAGLALAAVQLQRPEALWMTAYGRVLLAKLVLLAVLFTLAAINRFRLTKPAAGGDEGAVRRLRRSIRAEIALLLAIFAVAALWRFTPPPRALAEATAVPAAIHIHTEAAMADLSLTPGHVGPVAAEITIMTGDFGPLDAKELTLVLADEAAGIEPIRRKAIKGADAIWRVEGLDLPLPGRWQVRIEILVDDFRSIRLDDAIDIRP